MNITDLIDELTEKRNERCFLGENLSNVRDEIAEKRDDIHRLENDEAEFCRDIQALDNEIAVLEAQLKQSDDPEAQEYRVMRERIEASQDPRQLHLLEVEAA